MFTSLLLLTSVQTNSKHLNKPCGLVILTVST